MRYASLSLDLDNQWSYMKTHGDAGWQSHPSYLDAVVPRILELLGSRRLMHPLDFMGREDCPELAFFPGMDMARECKLGLLGELFDIFSSRYETITIGEQAQRASASRDPLRTLTPAFLS